jgi:hypothetical protein
MSATARSGSAAVEALGEALAEAASVAAGAGVALEGADATALGDAVRDAAEGSVGSRAVPHAAIAIGNAMRASGLRFRRMGGTYRPGVSIV